MLYMQEYGRCFIRAHGSLTLRELEAGSIVGFAPGFIIWEMPDGTRYAEEESWVLGLG